MDYNLHTAFHIEDKSYLPGIKNEIRRIGDELQMSIEEIGKLNIICTELVTNLVKYGEKDRQILVRPLMIHNNLGIEIVSIDKGPGAKDPGKMLEDGYSTSGTKGEGLGAVKRLSDEFDLYTHATGTIVLSRVLKKKVNIYDKPRDRYEYGGIMVAKKGEHVCGDQWLAEIKDEKFSLIVVDGLGHGPDANAAAVSAIETYQEHSKNLEPDQILSEIHNAIKKTRGAVGFVVMVNNQKKTLSYCGVGNISCRIIHNVNYENNKSVILFNGILGLNVKRMNSSQAPWDINKTIVVHSDGLTTRWDLQNYPGILNHHPTVIAAVLYRDHNRNTDDVTVVIARNKKAL